MTFLWIIVFFSELILIQGEDGCKVLDFLDCVKNKTFTGHVIKSFRILAPGLEDCQHKCFLEDKCVSYNLGPKEGMITSCELSDADHVTGYGDVVHKQGSEYCAIKNLCSSSPCPAGKWCTPDFYWNTFTCSDGRWTQWSEWSSCYCPQTRTRRCVNQQNNSAVCDRSHQDKPKPCKAATSIVGCSEPLGMQDGRIKDEQIVASSLRSKYCQAFYGRLYRTPSDARHTSWCAKLNQIGECLQIDLGSNKWLTRIATQGRGHYNQWVTKYTLSYSSDTTTWKNYEGDHDCTKNFIGNTDKKTVVTHELPVPIKTRYIRVVVQDWHSIISMRVELYGCTSL